MKKFKKLGFSEYHDPSSYRTGVFYEMHIDVYSDGKYNLYSRIIEKNVRYIKDNNRFTLFNSDGDVIVDIDLESIKDIMNKEYYDGCTDIVFTINGIRYKIFINGAQTEEYMCA